MTEANDGLVQMLKAAGIDQEDIDRAAAGGPEALLALYAERALLPGKERLNRLEVAERAGIPLEDAVEFWRALGFADVPNDEKAFNETDVEVLRLAERSIGSRMVDRDLALQTTRVLGRSIAQVASALVDTIRRSVGDENIQALPAVLANAPQLLNDVDKWAAYILRRHLAAEIRRISMQAGSAQPGTAVVGFADLVGFTAVSRSLDEPTLAAAVSKFESTCVDVVGRHDGRIVKMIGDEVMFETATPAQGAEISLDIVEAFTDDETLPDVRVGLALDTAVRHQGDIFGNAPNLASRLVEQAYPGSVLVSESVHDAIADDDRFTLKPVRVRHLKGIGRVHAFSLRRAGAESKARPRQKIPILGDLPIVGDVVAEVVGDLDR